MADARLERLISKLGRAPRVLHIGNVANNAFLNAALLNARGIDSDVLCYGNYHFMASPEWEELDQLRQPIADPDRPDWRAVSDGYERPRWFAQGPFDLATRYLEARRRGASVQAEVLWRGLEWRRELSASGVLRLLRSGGARRVPALAPPAGDAAMGADSDLKAYERARAWSAATLQRLSRFYDVVQGYGAEAILPFAAGVRPYIAWEHGTLRQLPFEPGVEGRLLAGAYQGANAVVITNADTRASADRLGLANYRFIPHPINERTPDLASVAATRAALTAELGADFIVLHPSRHHWSDDRDPTMEKSNDFLIEGLAMFLAQRPRAAAVFVDWGVSVAASRQLLEARGIANRVKWIPPQTGMSLARHMMATDVVADQFFLGAFGSTMPRAMWLERPSLIHLDAAAHAWCLPEMPPVINARAPDEIASGLLWACDDPAGRRDLGARARRWYDQYHSSRVLQDALSALYGEVLSGAER